jgi:hypothetical protein
MRDPTENLFEEIAPERIPDPGFRIPVGARAGACAIVNITLIIRLTMFDQ